jgi:UDP-2,3-diacylglucosamine pyrophosphatase LpxH
MKNKRRLDLLVLSDIHLGTYGCHARELHQYLKSVKPKMVVLNGDIVDIWQFSKNYFPKSHLKVLKHIMGWITKGVKVVYIPGNHDETLRRFAGLKIGSLQIANKLVLPLKDETTAWIFHGDVFDVTMQYSKWLAKLGGKGYDLLVLINRFVNFISERVLKKGKISLSKKVKNSVKSAVKFINQFEDTAAGIGINQGYQYVVCGHIHHPEIKEIQTDKGSITYLNSGDWIENLSALEYHDGYWSIYYYNEADYQLQQEPEMEENEWTNKELFQSLLKEFNIALQ